MVTHKVTDKSTGNGFTHKSGDSREKQEQKALENQKRQEANSIFTETPAAATQTAPQESASQTIWDRLKANDQKMMKLLDSLPQNQNNNLAGGQNPAPQSGTDYLLNTLKGNNPSVDNGPSYTYMNKDPKTGNLSLDSGLNFSKNSLDTLDPNKDGKLTVDEVNKLGTVDGKTMDIDKNGFISPGENLSLAIRQDNSLGQADGTVTSKEGAAADSMYLLNKDGFKEDLSNIYNHKGANGTPSIAERDQKYINQGSQSPTGTNNSSQTQNQKCNTSKNTASAAKQSTQKQTSPKQAKKTNNSTKPTAQNNKCTKSTSQKQTSSKSTSQNKTCKK